MSTDLIERLRTLAAKQRDERGDMLYSGKPDPELIEAADEIASLRSAIAELEVERDELAAERERQEQMIGYLKTELDEARAALAKHFPTSPAADTPSREGDPT